MNWHYQIRKRMIQGDAYYDIIEMFGGPLGWTEMSMSPSGDTRDELLADLERMLSDAARYPVFEEPV